MVSYSGQKFGMEFSTSHRNLFPAQSMFPIHSNKLLTNLRCATLCMQKLITLLILYLSNSPVSLPFWSGCHVCMCRPSVLFSLFKQMPIPPSATVSKTLPLVNTYCTLCLFIPYSGATYIYKLIFAI